MRADLTELSRGAEVGVQGTIGVTSVSHEVFWLERSRASELGRAQFESRLEFICRMG